MNDTENEYIDWIINNYLTRSLGDAELQAVIAGAPSDKCATHIVFNIFFAVTKNREEALERGLSVLITYFKSLTKDTKTMIDKLNKKNKKLEKINDFVVSEHKELVNQWEKKRRQYEK
jgi:hypothetical protein